jgi:membrane fusion protein, multidrug efflux system
MNTASNKLPLVLSAAIALAVVLWMASGMFANSKTSATETSQASSAVNAIQQVRVQQLMATSITREVVVSGRTEPNRTLQIRAEAEGTVQQLGSARGDTVKAGSLLAKLDLRDRNARLNEAAALVAQRELELSGAENLRTKQFTTDVQIAEAKARLASAKAAAERIKLEITNTTMTAPYDAVLQDRSVEIGDFVRVGDNVAELVDLDPIIVTGEVNEREVAAMAVGSKGIAVLVDGRRLEGEVRYLAPKAESSTRTFQIELAIPNPENTVRAGMTAELRLFADNIRIHTLSAALLTLADDGTIGAKLVDNTNTVRFYPVALVGTGPDGQQQVSGLPEAIKLITVGQGFVVDGQKVEPVMMTTTLEQ